MTTMLFENHGITAPGSGNIVNYAATYPADGY